MIPMNSTSNHALQSIPQGGQDEPSFPRRAIRRTYRAPAQRGRSGGEDWAFDQRHRWALENPSQGLVGRMPASGRNGSPSNEVSNLNKVVSLMARPKADPPIKRINTQIYEEDHKWLLNYYGSQYVAEQIRAHRRRIETQNAAKIQLKGIQ